MSLDFLDQLIGNSEESLVQGDIGPLTTVEPGAEVGPSAAVVGRAHVGGSAKVLEGAKVGGYARIEGNAVLRGNVIVGGFAEILGGEWTTGSVTEGTWSAPGIPGRALRQKTRLSYIKLEVET